MSKQLRESMSPTPKEIGRSIRIQRLASGMSQTDLANEIGVTFQQVQKYEKGEKIAAGRLSKIAKVLNIPVSEFLGTAPRPKPQKRLVSRRRSQRSRSEDFVVSIPGGELRTAVRLSPSANAFLQRSMGAMLRIAAAEKEDRLTEAMAAPTDVGTIARALANTEVVGASVTDLDPLASLIAKGVEDKQKLIQEAGGLLSVGEVAKVRGLTPQAIHKQRRARKLLSVPYGGEEKFPAIQFTDEGQPVPGLSTVLQALHLEGAWGTLDFFLSPDDELDGLSPIEMLKRHPEKLEEVVRLASTQGEHGPG
jgi:transcriptional regulator with XRE-family HTH domain